MLAPNLANAFDATPRVTVSYGFELWRCYPVLPNRYPPRCFSGDAVDWGGTR